MRLKITFVLLPTFAILILLSQTTTFAKPPVIIDPCDVITQVDAEKIMGEKLKRGQLREQKAIGQKICLYEAVDDNSFTMLQVSLLQGQRAKEIFVEIKKNFPDHESVRGIGDDAFIATPGIHILKNDYYLTIAAGNLNRNRDKVQVAGRKAVARLEMALK
jgi:hypothetical protein